MFPDGSKLERAVFSELEKVVEMQVNWCEFDRLMDLVPVANLMRLAVDRESGNPVVG